MSTLKTNVVAENDTAVKKAYLQHILETKSSNLLSFGSQGTVGLPRGYDKKDKLLFFVQAKTKLEKEQLISTINAILEGNKIKAYNPKGDLGTFIVATKNIIVHESFVEGMRTDKGQVAKLGVSNSSGDLPVVKTGHDAILQALSLHDVTCFEEEKPRTDNSVKIILPEDSGERDYAKLVLSQFAFEVEDCEKYCLKVLVNGKKTVEDIVFVPGLEKPDKMRFGMDLVSAINITAFELQRQRANVDTFVFDLAGEATKSTPFKFIKGSSSLKPEAQAQDFIDYMMKTYGVDIQPEIKDPNICRVVSPKDPDHAGTSDAQEKRQRKQRDSHPITVYLVKNGIPMSKAGSGGGTYGSLHLNFGLPKSITVVKAKDLDERIAFAKMVCDLLNLDPEMAKYGAFQDERAPQKVMFKPIVRKTRSDAHPLYAELENLGFPAYTRERSKENRLHFLVRFARNTKSATTVSFYGGEPEQCKNSAKRLEKYFNSTNRPAKAEEGKVKLETPIPADKGIASSKNSQQSAQSRKTFAGPKTDYQPEGNPFIDALDTAYLVRIRTDKNLQASVLAVLNEVLPEAFSNSKGLDKETVVSIYNDELTKLKTKAKDVFGNMVIKVEDLDEFNKEFINQL